VLRKYVPPIKKLLGEERINTSYRFDPNNITMRIGDFRVFLNESTEDFQPKMCTEFLSRQDKILQSVKYSLDQYPEHIELLKTLEKKLELIEQEKVTIKKMRKAVFLKVLRDLEKQSKY
jgi:hypothetical protein